MPDYHTTTDLYYAAYLKTMGVPFEGIERTHKTVTFLFDPEEGEIDELVIGYYNRTIEVPALQLVEEIKVMKAMIHQR